MYNAWKPPVAAAPDRNEELNDLEEIGEGEEEEPAEVDAPVS